MFKDGIPDGHGIYQYGTGAQAKGQWIRGKLNGKGEFHQADGSYYEGDFVDHLKEGYGTFIFANKQGFYVGDWKKNCFDGNGEMKWPDGSSYKGTYKMNQYLSGTFTTKSGKQKKVNYSANV